MRHVAGAAHGLLAVVLSGIAALGMNQAWAAEGVSPMEGDMTAIIIGASYAADWPAERLAGMTIVNRGIGGQETQDMAERFGRDALEPRPDRVIIWGFVNNVFRAAPQTRDEAVERMQADYRAMLDAASAEGIDVVLVTEVPTGRVAGFKNRIASWVGALRGRQSYQEQINAHVASGNAWIREQGAERGVPVMDFEQLVMGSRGLRRAEFTTDDGSHLTPEAYAAMTRHADEFLRRHVAN
jgi:lysophospholipase L1-like esterase